MDDTDHLLSSQIFKRSSYLQPVVSSEQADQQLQETVGGNEAFLDWTESNRLCSFQVEELQKTVDTLSDQKRNTTERLSKIQSENTDLKSRWATLFVRFSCCTAVWRLLALEDRFHDLEGQNARTARNDQQKYTEYIVSTDDQWGKEKLTAFELT